MFGLFNPKPLLDPSSVDWILAIQDWIYDPDNGPGLKLSGRLVCPNNEDFPGRASSVEEKASLLLEQIQAHAGLAHWPCTAITQEDVQHLQDQQALADNQRYIVYPASAVGDTQALIATMVQQLAAHLVRQASTPPPADEEQWPLVVELLGIQLGFGVMFANSAFAFRGGCGGCRTPNRAVYLSQDEATFALALFCHTHSIDRSQVFKHLKKHLPPIYRRAAKNIHATLPSKTQLKRLEIS